MLIKKACIFIILLLASSAVLAGEIRFNGFFTAAGGLMVDSGTTYLGYDEDFSFEPDSVLGIQVHSDLNEKFSLTGQFIGRGIEEFDAEIAWAFASYQATDSLKFRAGKMRAPVYFYSDYLDVGYAYPWITPPNLVYKTVPFSDFSGVDFVYSPSTGNWDTTIQGLFGRKTGTSTAVGGLATNYDLVNMTGLNLLTANNWFQFRLGYNRADATIAVDSLNPLFAGLDAAGLTNVADLMRGEGHNAEFMDAAIGLDFSHFIARAEYVFRTHEESFFQDQTGTFLMMGFRAGSFLIHATFSHFETDLDYEYANLIPLGANPVYDALHANVRGVIDAQSADQDELTVGIRYNLQTSSALKLDVTQYEETLLPDSDVTLVRLGWNMVF